jgi:methionyl-tRNA formyltransferase
MDLTLGYDAMPLEVMPKGIIQHLSNSVPHPGEAGRHPRVIFFGLRCRMSCVPLVSLLARGLDVRAVVIPAPRREVEPLAPIAATYPRMTRAWLPLTAPGQDETIDQVATRHNIPLLQASALSHPETLDILGKLAPDVIAVSCFPRRLPPNLLSIAPLGALNLHPSLLPRYRGPDPLFWIYRHGEERTGVTVHQMTQHLDAGDILGQQAFDLPDGLPGDALEVQCAEVGGRLLADTVWALWNGTAVRVAQDEQLASYQRRPSPGDLVIRPDWPARQAWNFIRGVIPLGYIPVVETDIGRSFVRQALGFDVAGTLGASSRLEGHDLSVQCNPGVLRVVIGGAV